MSRSIVFDQRSAPGGEVPGERKGPTLLMRLRQAIRQRHYSRRTEETYVGWVKRFVAFHGRRHPAELGAAEVSSFLSHLASD
ncbi:MAG: phage integrase N-terminal SAM-like domain-containing protein, partial [Gemmatimonadetes bacterium]|nr:phage integrase N-terminal SAM-like domain-containing protein [Gemmatimonadota bacterium]